MKTKEKRKKDIVDILVYIAMVCFMLLIILPPVLRLVMPKEEEQFTKDEVAALICNKQDTYDAYLLKTTIRTNYKNDQPMMIKMTFTDTSGMENPYQMIIDQLKAMNGILTEEKDGLINITIPESVLNQNIDNSILKNYGKELKTQQEYYEQEGMTCAKY